MLTKNLHVLKLDFKFHFSEFQNFGCGGPSTPSFLLGYDVLSRYRGGGSAWCQGDAGEPQYGRCRRELREQSRTPGVPRPD